MTMYILMLWARLRQQLVYNWFQCAHRPSNHWLACNGMVSAQSIVRDCRSRRNRTAEPSVLQAVWHRCWAILACCVSHNSKGRLTTEGIWIPPFSSKGLIPSWQAARVKYFRLHLQSISLTQRKAKFVLDCFKELPGRIDPVSFNLLPASGTTHDR